MKVFFTASLRGQKEFGKYWDTIYNTIKELGYTHLDDEIFTLSQKYYKEMESEGRKAYVDLYHRKMKRIQEADLTIFETSLPSLSIGYQIEKSLYYNKPTIVLYYEKFHPEFLLGSNDEKLIIKSYNNSNLIEILKKSIEEARQNREKRFNFFISPSLLTYLEESSKKQNITKSTFIRNLIIQHHRKTKSTSF